MAWPIKYSKVVENDGGVDEDEDDNLLANGGVPENDIEEVDSQE